MQSQFEMIDVMEWRNKGKLLRRENVYKMVGGPLLDEFDHRVFVHSHHQGEVSFFVRNAYAEPGGKFQKHPNQQAMQDFVMSVAMSDKIIVDNRLCWPYNLDT